MYTIVQYTQSIKIISEYDRLMKQCHEIVYPFISFYGEKLYLHGPHMNRQKRFRKFFLFADFKEKIKRKKYLCVFTYQIEIF